MKRMPDFSSVSKNQSNQSNGSLWELGFALGIRNLKAKYRQSVLGLFWAFLPPLITAFIWIFLTGQGVINMKDTGVPYPLFVIIGTSVWQLFSQAVLMPINVVTANKSVLTKLNFKRESILIAGLIELLIPFLATVIIISVAMGWFGVLPAATAPLALLVLLALMGLGIAIGLWLLPIGVLYKDVSFALPPMLQVFMYLTPVVYPEPVFTGLGRILAYNPLSPFFELLRGSLITEIAMPDPMALTWIIPMVVIGLWIGVKVFKISMQVLIERMGS